MNLAEVARFGAVGVLQNALNVAVFAAFIALGVGYSGAALIAFAAALLASYALNRRWTFAAGPPADPRQLRRYILVFLAASGVGVMILALLVEVAHWNAVPAQVAAIVIVAPLSYLAQRTFAFRMPKRAPPSY